MININSILKDLRKKVKENNIINKLVICKNVTEHLENMYNKILVYNLYFLNQYNIENIENIENIDYNNVLNYFKNNNHLYFINYIDSLYDYENKYKSSIVNINNNILYLQELYYNNGNKILNNTTIKTYLNIENILNHISYKYISLYLYDIIITYLIPQRKNNLTIDYINFPIFNF